jgi:hypothetical protein
MLPGYRNGQDIPEEQQDGFCLLNNQMKYAVRVHKILGRGGSATI